YPIWGFNHSIDEHNVEPLMHSPAGQGIAMLREETTVAGVMARLIAETRAALDQLRSASRF
ncbi:MAG: hypothetical protein ACYDCQ_02955, partial [Dehalococcoidia bacterium]